jgi:hypothetical protein
MMIIVDLINGLSLYRDSRGDWISIYVIVVSKDWDLLMVEQEINLRLLSIYFRYLDKFTILDYWDIDIISVENCHFIFNLYNNSLKINEKVMIQILVLRKWLFALS